MSVQAQAGNPQLILNKEIEGGATTAQVGDVIRYRIRFECSSLTGPCGQMQITDVLPPGLIYQPPPASSVPAGFTISYNAGTRTITITKNDNDLLDGSQYDAVIAVRVDYDLRPLPATISNEVGGWIDPPGPTGPFNATPDKAPDVHIGTASPHWGITKSLYSPTVNPTVNTNVTYRVQLCPTTPPVGEGNAPLQNIILTDTLPTNATFVSASDGGTAASGVVTWPAVPGPLYPPNCLTRYVTIRYDSSNFIVGNTITNTANANAQSIPPGGGLPGPGTNVANNTITHRIDAIAEVPSYSKDDIGDPVGMNGTGRFILNLNTNATNYPANQLILIDNLPPEFQVTGVTSGQWSAAFEHVSASIEYSTNNGTSYTPFPGQPVHYNSNATYSAPVNNITNVRWVFAYDPDGVTPFTYTQPGLPYSWSFTTRPEIRVIPRTTAVTSPPAAVPLPAAVAGTTYDNCLQVSRTDSTGAAIVDPCNIEPMTVQGSVVSLRTYKQETPGTGWDDADDPFITSFTADGSILPGDTVRYTITIEVTERSSAPLINPTIRDVLPPMDEFIFVRNGAAYLDGVELLGTQKPTFTPGPSDPPSRVLTWQWNNLTVNPLPLSSRYLTVEFYGRIPRGQAPGTYTNSLYAVTDSDDVICEVGSTIDDNSDGYVDPSLPDDPTLDQRDVDGDGDPTDPACQNPDDYVVERSAALRGEKWIRSISPDNSQVVDAQTFLPRADCPNGGTVGLANIPSNPFTRYPCISQAFPEGALSPGHFSPPVPPATTDPALDDFEYNLRIFNDGNVAMLRYVLYDILPYVGDTGSGGTLASQPRQSAFQPTLRGPVEFIPGLSGLSSTDFAIEYNNTTNPCRPEVFNQPTGAIVPAGCNNTWTPTWSTLARSYRIRLINGSIPPASTSSEIRFGV
ncbi:MAG TPA: hypothetical protein VHP14_15305, partial [Anaerolineales bacterium]|nr:hypothetical protein [Anaerolineales bacterium]